MRWLPALLLIIMMMAAPCQADPYAKYNRVKKFDRHFSKYSKRYFGPAFDWRFFKAQAVAESGQCGSRHRGRFDFYWSGDCDRTGDRHGPELMLRSSSQDKDLFGAFITIFAGHKC